MKSKKNIKIVICVVSLVILMFGVGCSNTNKNPNNQQSSTTSGNSENNKSSDETPPSTTTDNPTLKGNVTKIDGNKIIILKITQKSNGTSTAHKKGSPAAANDIGTFEVSKDTAVTVRTTSDKGMEHTDTAGAISDIKVDSLVDVWGEKAKDTVTATKVMVYIFN